MTGQYHQHHVGRAAFRAKDPVPIPNPMSLKASITLKRFFLLMLIKKLIFSSKGKRPSIFLYVDFVLNDITDHMFLSKIDESKGNDSALYLEVISKLYFEGVEKIFESLIKFIFQLGIC